MLMRFDPFREFDRMSQQLLGNGRPSSPPMPLDAYREGDRFVLRFDVPGIDAASLEVTLEKNVLSVSAERNWQPAQGQEVVIAERPQGTFSRQLFLGEGLDAERISATYDNGVLTVELPVAEQAKPRKVLVSAGSGRATPIETNASDN